MVILYSALSIPLDLAMNGGRGPVVGMCGLFASLLMDCGRSARWMGLADQLLLLLLLRLLLWLVCVVRKWSWSVCRDWLAGWLAEWLSSECATLTSGYSMRMAGWPNRNDNRLDGRG